MAKELHLEERREEKIRKENGWGVPEESNDAIAGMVEDTDEEEDTYVMPLLIKPTPKEKAQQARAGSSSDGYRIPRKSIPIDGGKNQESTRGRTRELSTRERELEFTRGRKRGDSKERERVLSQKERGLGRRI